MTWYAWLIIGIAIGGSLGVVLCSVLCSAGTNSARYVDGGNLS